MATSKRFVPHFHIPLQSGSNEILNKMKRRYLRELYTERVAKIKSMMPNCCIGVDVIVGFPGESDQHFLETYDFVNGLDISYLHVFTYSERDNTPAILMENPVPMAERKKRSKMLRILSAKKLRAFYDTQKGKNLKVLFEQENKNGLIHGFTQNYVRVSYPFSVDFINKSIDVTINDFDEEGDMNCLIDSPQFIKQN